jgi:DNA polymerase III sliding clamp (beta) subunit (PCNA family)
VKSENNNNKRALFEAGQEGITFRSTDPSHIALIDIKWSRSAFEQYDFASTIKFRVRIDEFSIIIKRANANDSIESGEDNFTPCCCISLLQQ